MDRGISPDDFGLAFAALKIQNESLFILICNDVFTLLTSLIADNSFDCAEQAFGSRYKELLQRITVNKELTLPFRTTGKSLRIRTHKKDDKHIEIVGVDYTNIQRKLELFEMHTRGYRQFIDHLHGISYQRMLKPEAIPVFTAGAVEKMTGYREDQAKDLNTWLGIIHPEDRERMKDVGLELYEEPGYEKESEYRIIRKDGAVRWVRSYDNHFISEDGEYDMVQGLIVDVTEQKKQEEKIRHISMTDYMTGLSNRRFMQKVINYYISDFKRSGITFSLLMIDLDHFKRINDKYGHDGGDAVIVRMAKVLRNTLRETDIKARWGGEEFLILLPRTGRDEAEAIAGKLLDKIRSEKVIHNKIDIEFTFSGGIAVNDRKLSDEILLKQADRALYAAKEKGRNRIVFLKE